MIFIIKYFWLSGCYAGPLHHTWGIMSVNYRHWTRFTKQKCGGGSLIHMRSPGNISPVGIGLKIYILMSKKTKENRKYPHGQIIITCFKLSLYLPLDSWAFTSSDLNPVILPLLYIPWPPKNVTRKIQFFILIWSQFPVAVAMESPR